MSLLKRITKVLLHQMPDKTAQIYLVYENEMRELALDCRHRDLELARFLAKQTAHYFLLSDFEEEGE